MTNQATTTSFTQPFKPYTQAGHATPALASDELEAAIHREVHDSLPFFLLMLGGLFFVYFLFEWFILKTFFASTVVMALVSSLGLFVLLLLRQQNQLRPDRANGIALLVGLLMAVNVLLRLFVNQDIVETAYVVLYLMAVGGLILSTRWIVGLLSLTAVIWAIAAFFIIPYTTQTLYFSLLLVLTYIATVMVHLIRRKSFTYAESVRLENERLVAEMRQFNKRLESEVQARTVELQRANAELERLDKTRSDFITIASHELRTPLTIINMHNQMLSESPEIQGDKLYTKWSRSIQRGVTRMEDVVESMLDVAKIDSRSLELYTNPLNLNLLMRMIIGRFYDAAAERNITLKLNDLSGLPEIDADQSGLQKVFMHLIMNGIKFTPDGGKIEINGRLRGDNTIQLIIADTGIGIARDAQKLIFKKFFQTGEVMQHSSGKTSFKGGGPGLGLTIAKGIVEAHNGHMWVESEGYSEETFPGSRFFIILPIKQTRLTPP